MRIILAALFLLASINVTPACQIAMSVSAPTANPAISVTKRWNDTDANCQIMADALNAANPIQPPPTDSAAAFSQWFTNNMNSLTNLTNRYQRIIAPITPIDPAPQ